MPRMYGLLKLHKSDILDDIPIGPVVSFTNIATYEMAKLISLDVSNLFTNIPVNDPIL